MPIRFLAGVAVFAALALTSVLDLPPPNEDPYRIAVQLQRFSELRAALPKGAKVGYLSDLPESSVGGSAALLGAQYSLAPALIEAEDKPHDLVVGNFAGQQDFARVGQEHSLSLVKDFGNGVILYRRQAP